MSDFQLNRVSIFKKLKPEEVSILEQQLEERVYQKDEIIFRRGDTADALYIVKEGEIDIFLDSENGEVILASITQGNFFGELGLFDNERRSAHARAAQDSVLIALNRQFVMDYLEQHPAAALRILSVVTSRLRHADEMMTRLVTRNVNELVDSKMTFGERIADRVATFGGSWTFIIIFGAFLLTWMALNSIEFLFRPFDPFPFIFLNLMLSCVAALQAPIIMMSQNRQSLKDRLHAELDFQVNLKAEIAIQQMHRKIDELRQHNIQELEMYQQEQLRRLEEIVEVLRSMKPI